MQLFLEEPQWIDKVTKAHSHITGMSKLEAWRQFLGILGSRPYGTSSIPPEPFNPCTALLSSWAKVPVMPSCSCLLLALQCTNAS